MIRLDCRQASRLMSKGLDEALPFSQRTALRLHLLVCSACSRVEAQFGFLHRAASHYPGPDEDELRPNAKE
jgi:hypothetical protein